MLDEMTEGLSLDTWTLWQIKAGPLSLSMKDTFAESCNRARLQLTQSEGATEPLLL